MKQFVRDHFEDFVNKRNAAVIRKNMTSDFHDHDGPGGKPTGVDGDEQMMLSMYKAMPDLHLTIEEMIAEGDKSCAAISGVGLTPLQGRRYSFMASCFGGSRVTKSPNAGLR
jgi:predicted ester cyclase